VATGRGPVLRLDVVSNPAVPRVPSVSIPLPAIPALQRDAVPLEDASVKGRKLWKDVLAKLVEERSDGSSATFSSPASTRGSTAMGNICASLTQDIFQVNNSSSAATCPRRRPTLRRGSASTRPMSLLTPMVAAHSALMAVPAVSLALALALGGCGEKLNQDDKLDRQDSLPDGSYFIYAVQLQ